jgi:hypothetical protein
VQQPATVAKQMLARMTPEAVLCFELVLAGVERTAPFATAVAGVPGTPARAAPAAAPAASASADPRPVCQYGLGCYRNNPTHFRDFAHPGHPKNVPHVAAAVPPPAPTAAAVTAAGAGAGTGGAASVSLPLPKIGEVSSAGRLLNAALLELNAEVHNGSKTLILDTVMENLRLAEVLCRAGVPL